MQSPRCRTWVAWFDHLLPNGVAVGRDVIVYGKLMTFGNARSFQLVDAVVIKNIGRRQIAAALAEVLKDYIVEPPARPGPLPNGHDQS